jgi:hypothetical protein
MKSLTMISEWRMALAAMLAVLATDAGCSSTPGTSGETHFVCQATPDCEHLGDRYTCAKGVCTQTVASGSAGGSGGGTTIDNGGSAAGRNGGSSGTAVEGTWDVVGTQYSGTPTSLVVMISPSQLSITALNGFLTVVGQGDRFSVTIDAPSVRSHRSPGSSPVPFDAVRTPIAGSAGDIPLPLFGNWQVHDAESRGCGATVTTTTLAGSCGNTGHLPPWMPDIAFGTVTATRTRTLDSLFGDFGGDWSLTTSGGATCSVRFEGSTMSSQCSGGRGPGSASLTFEGETAHGFTSAGVEFSAQRR